MKKWKKHSKLVSGCSPCMRGYSLIEMAIAMLVVGLMIAPAADVYSNYLKHKKVETTLTNVQDVLTAIQTYRTANGVFPCPSGLNVARTSANYGAPVNCTSTGPYAVTPAFGACNLVAGICIEQSRRVAVPPFDAFHQRVIVGAVPFRQLQLTEKKAYDGYGNRLVYVMTQSEGDIATLNTLNGGITIRDPAGKSVVKPDDSAVYAIIAPGLDGVGGWTSQGGLQRACVGAAGADVTNCNPGFEGGAPKALSLLIDGYQSSAVGANHYDDYIMYFQSQPDPLWSYVTGTTNIMDLTDQSVGVGVTNPVAGAQIDIAAATSAGVYSDGTNNTDALLVYGTAANGNTGKIGADRICDANGANCFDPIHIGGTKPGAAGVYAAGDPGMGCNSTTSFKYMSGIDGAAANVAATGGADCAAMVRKCPTVMQGGVPVQQVLNGFVNGVPNCVTVPISCGPLNATPPGTPACPALSAASGIDGATITFSKTSSAPYQWDTGGCRSVSYTCNQGVWSAPTDNGQTCQLAACTNTPACDCTVLHNANYTGTCTYQTCPNCSGGNTTTLTVDSCTCRPNLQETENCPSPWTGGTRKRTTTFNGVNCNGSTGNWNESQCTCSRPATTTSSTACPAGYNSGSGVITGTLQNDCTYTYNTSYSSCTCVPPNPTTRTINVACPSPAVGTGQQNQTFNSNPGTCAWENTGQIQNCACPANTTNTQPCPAPWGSGNQTQSVTYGSPPICQQTLGSWDTSGCNCPTNYVETVPCDAPALGNKTRPHTFGVGPSCTETIGPWNTSACGCPANTTELQACPAPYTGGTQSRPVTYGAAPTCTQSVGTWDTSACQCSQPATQTQTLGCGPGYNAGGRYQSSTLNTSTCTYGPWTDTGNDCACNAPNPSTVSNACGSCVSPWSGTQLCDSTFSSTAGPPSPPNCAWGPPGAPYGCVCDTTPQPFTQPHDCSANPPYGLDCYQPNMLDQDTGTVTNVAGAGTCTAGSPVITHQGTCSLRQFTWVNGVATGNQQNPKPNNPNYLGAGCGCPEHRNTLLGFHDTCYSPDPSNFNQYDCDCQ